MMLFFFSPPRQAVSKKDSFFNSLPPLPDLRALPILDPALLHLSSSACFASRLMELLNVSMFSSAEVSGELLRDSLEEEERFKNDLPRQEEEAEDHS